MKKVIVDDNKGMFGVDISTLEKHSKTDDIEILEDCGGIQPLKLIKEKKKSQSKSGK